MTRDEGRWFEENGDLNVFVPGLMATGILVSIGMLIWDAIKKFLPDVGRKQRAARLSMQTAGRISDLTSIAQGESPRLGRVDRVRRSRGNALLLSVGALALAAMVSFVTLAAYFAEQGTLAGRGWTLTMGLSVAIAFVILAVLWAVAAVADEGLPAWAERAQGHWPVGTLPDATDGVEP